MIARIGTSLFILLIVMLGFMQPGIRIAGMQVTGADLVFPLLFASVVALLLRRQVQIADRKFTVLLVILALASAASAAFSINRLASGVKLLGIIYLVGLAFSAAVVVADRSTLRKVVLVWIGTSTVISILGCVAVVGFYLGLSDLVGPMLHHYGSLAPGNYPRIQSTFIYPAMLCNYLTAGVLLTLGAGKAGWITTRIRNVSLGVQIIAAVFTLTPGLAGLFAATAFWAAYLTRDNGRSALPKMCIFAGSAVAAVAVIVSAFSLRAIETSPYTFDLLGTRIDPTQRLLTWQGGIETFLQYPVFGKGLGMPPAQVIFKSPTGMQMLTDAHHTIISLLAQGGVVVFLSFGALLIFVLKIGWRRIDDAAIDPIRMAVWISLFSGMLIQGLVGSFEDSRHLWVLMGMLVAIHYSAIKSEVKTRTMHEGELPASRPLSASEVRPV